MIKNIPSDKELEDAVKLFNEYEEQTATVINFQNQTQSKNNMSVSHVIIPPAADRFCLRTPLFGVTTDYIYSLSWFPA